MCMIAYMHNCVWLIMYKTYMYMYMYVHVVDVSLGMIQLVMSVVSLMTVKCQ